MASWARTPEGQKGRAAKIILLNGASSAGKSTLALSLQQQLPEPFLHWSFDHLRASEALPMARIRSGGLDWASMRPAVFDGFHRCLPGLAQALHCPLPELERRERHRGDRRPGEARRDFHAVHRFTEYDLDIDATQPTEGNVARLITAWQARSRPTAFERMATR